MAITKHWPIACRVHDMSENFQGFNKPELRKRSKFPSHSPNFHLGVDDKQLIYFTWPYSERALHSISSSRGLVETCSYSALSLEIYAAITSQKLIYSSCHAPPVFQLLCLKVLAIILLAIILLADIRELQLTILSLVSNNRSSGLCPVNCVGKF